MKTITLLLLIASAALAQGPSGTMTYTPPTPAQVVGGGGSLTCTVVGNAVPATAVVFSCAGSMAIPQFTVPMPASTQTTLSFGRNGDAVLFTFTSSAAGVISWNGSATPNGGNPGIGNGTL